MNVVRIPSNSSVTIHNKLLSSAQGNPRSGIGYHRHFKLSISLPSLLDVYIFFRCHLLSFVLLQESPPDSRYNDLGSDCLVRLLRFPYLPSTAIGITRWLH